MKFRHEIKHEINYTDRLVLLSRLSAVMKRDSHSVNGEYFIRSLYFDTPNNKALKEKQDGVNIREKFRIRYYNNDLSYIVLEKKSKINGLCAKESCRLSVGEVEKIINGDFRPGYDNPDPLCTELYIKMKSEGLKPRIIVDYNRIPFVFAPGNVRVTIDYNIRTGFAVKDFLSPDAVTLPAGDEATVLEVKWDEFLPDIIKDAVRLPARHSSSFSKYEKCRVYG